MKHMFRHSLIANTPGLLDLRTAKINLMLLPAPRVRSSRVSRPRRASTAEKGVEPKVDAPPATQGRGRTDRPERAGGLGLSCPPRRVTDTGEHRFPAAPPQLPTRPPGRLCSLRCRFSQLGKVCFAALRGPPPQSISTGRGRAATSKKVGPPAPAPFPVLRYGLNLCLCLSLSLSLSPSLPLSLSPSLPVISIHMI